MSNKRKAITATPVTTVTTAIPYPCSDAVQARHRKLIEAAITQQQMGYDKGKTDFLVKHGPFFGLDKSDLNDYVVATYAILPIWQGYARQYRALHNKGQRLSQMEYCRQYIHQGSGSMHLKSRQLSMSLRALDILSELGDKKLPVPSNERKAVSNKRKAITTTPVTTRHRKLIEAAITQQQMGYDKWKTDFLVKYGLFFGLDKSDLQDYVVATYAILPIWQGYARQYRALHNTEPRYSQAEYCRQYIHQGSDSMNTKSRQLSMSLRALDILSELGDKKLPVPSNERKAVSNKRKAITTTPVTTVTTSPSPSSKRCRRSKDAAQARHRKLIEAAITQQQIGYNKGKTNFLVRYGPFFGLDKSDLNDYVIATQAILPIWQSHARQYRALHNTEPRYSQAEYCRQHSHEGSSNMTTRGAYLSMALRALDILREVGYKKLPFPSNDTICPSSKSAETTTTSPITSSKEEDDNSTSSHDGNMVQSSEPPFPSNDTICPSSKSAETTTTSPTTSSKEEDDNSTSSHDGTMVQSSEPPETHKPSSGTSACSSTTTTSVKKGTTTTTKTTSDDIFTSIWGFVKKSLEPWQLKEDD